jgi:MoaA/NifB/PqqE/SkfB family radical SAM enzyme/predicted dehydrogenase
MQRTRSSVDVSFRGRCTLGCAPCDCGRSDEPGRFERVLAGSEERVVLRGCAETRADLPELIRRVRDAGKVVVLRTNAIAFARPEAARRLASLGLDAVLVPIFSHHPTPHDKIAGRAGSLQSTLEGIAGLVLTGLGIEIEVPLMNARLQNLDRILDMVRAVAPRLEHIRLFVPLSKMPSVLVPPPWDEHRPAVEAFLHRCIDEKVRVQIDPPDGIPQCAIPSDEDLWPIVRFAPRGKAAALPGASYPEACDTCEVRPQCGGVVAPYHVAHGGRGLVPFGRKPRRLYEQRTTPRPQWTELRRRAASTVEYVVLRPTVNCNQDCPFCSANETSSDIWPDPEQMLRRIARVGRTGVKRISFSGGEPMLSPHIVSYIRAARRADVPIVELVTNAVLLASPTRAQAVVDAGLTHAFVSLHAHTEALSRHQTRKVGDFGKTITGIENLLDRNVLVVLNHVINARNYRYLRRFVEFVNDEFGGKTQISFAFITPQFQALERIDLMPRYSEVMPFLRDALYRAQELGQGFHVGSRQGIPPCQLREFEYWSDVLDSSSSAASEDAHQKIRSPVCNDCKYSSACTGVWKPYADVYGLSELRALHDTLDPDARGGAGARGPIPFDQVPDMFRDREAEAEYAAGRSPPAPQTNHELPDETGYTRRTRLLLVGTGRRARVLARELMRDPDLLVGCVASPHAPDGDLGAFGHAPAYRDTARALDEQDTNAMVIASNTASHLEAIRMALEANVPVLVEKPVVPLEHTDALVELLVPGRSTVMPAHQVLFADGLAEVLAGPVPHAVTYSRVMQSNTPDTPRFWSPDAIFELLYHGLVLVGRAAGGGEAAVEHARITGTSRPLRVDARLQYASTTAELSVDLDGSADTLRLTLDGDRAWARVDRSITATLDGVAGPVPRVRGELAGMLAAFHRVVRGDAPEGLPTVREALDVAANARAVIDVLLQAEPRLVRAPNAPRHAQTLHRALTLSARVRKERPTDPLGILGLEGRLPSSPGPAPAMTVALPSLPLELAALRAGIKPVAFLTVRPDEEAAIRSAVSGYAVERRERGVWVEAQDRWVDDRTRGEPRIELYISADSAAAAEAARLQAEGDPSRCIDELGALMGYPECCVRAFGLLDDRSNNSRNRYSTAARTTGVGAWPWELNNLFVAIIPFFPCSYRCARALAHARATLAAAEREEAGLTARLHSVLARPVLYFDHEHQVILDGTTDLADDADDADGAGVVQVRGASVPPWTSVTMAEFAGVLGAAGSLELTDAELRAGALTLRRTNPALGFLAPFDAVDVD